MARILVNGLEQALDSPCKYWGEALEQLDQRVGRDGQLLTAVRFDGVDQPSFRDQGYDRMEMSDLVVVEVEGVRRHDLLVDGADEAATAARTLSEAAQRLGDGFRGFDVAYANQDLVELAEGLGTLVSVVGILSQAVGLPLEQFEVAGSNAGAMIAELSGFASALIDAQNSEDWITVADIIEYDIAPALQKWPDLIEALRARIPE
jgi:hypothetical protein